MLLAAAATVPAAFVSDLAHRLAPKHAAPETPSSTQLPPPGSPHRLKDHLALGLFKTEPVLGRLLTLIFLTQLVATVLGLAFQGTLHDALPQYQTRSPHTCIHSSLG